jgi:hypothetical protein
MNKILAVTFYLTFSLSMPIAVNAGSQQQAYDSGVKRHGSGPYDKQLSNAVGEWLCQREQ